jgi:tRNA(Ile)-lysidine synthase
MVNDDNLIVERILKKVRETILEHEMLKTRDGVLVGVSGGPDSMALLHILLKIKSELGIKLAVAHLNHGLRGEESDRDADFVLKTGKNLGLECFMERIDVGIYQQQHGLSMEQAARKIRYGVFYRLTAIHGFNKIALGHHQDDNAEMVLMAIMRGSGPLGLSGIPPVRDGKIIRPLMGLTRRDILSFLKALGQDFVIDGSNADTTYLRNRIRHRLIPLLKSEYNPEIKGSLNRLSEILRSEEDWLNRLVVPLFQSCVITSEEHRLALGLSRLKDHHPALQRRILRKALEEVKGNLKGITFHHVDAIIKMTHDNSGMKRLDLPGRVMVLILFDRILISKEKQDLRNITAHSFKDPQPEFSHEIHTPGSLYVPETGMRFWFSKAAVETLGNICYAGQQTAFFDIKKIEFPLELRNFFPKDSFVPLGMEGTKTVDKFLKDLKITCRERRKIPVLLSGGKIIWVVGYRIDDAFRVTAQTDGVLTARVEMP